MYINTEDISVHLRKKAINLDERSLLITSFSGSDQEKDLTEPSNCNGYGRIRHFKLGSGIGWPVNPLPILPALKALDRRADKEIRAQVFQNSICNWRCWYCFVDFSLLNGDTRRGAFLTCEEMLDMYLALDNPPPVIDLTGGQPDLTPEWVPWMMEAIKNRGLQDKIYLWSDDNLSNDYLWRFLSSDQMDLITSYKMYSRVCCFKGIDQESFSLNTKATPELFDNQFALCKRLLDLKLDLYFYITLTSPSSSNFEDLIPKFFDKVQEINELLPLRIVPLKVFEFTPVKSRMNYIFSDMLEGQERAITIWMKELQGRFSFQQLKTDITEINFW